MKKGVRVLSVEGAPFKKSDKDTIVIGIISRGQLIEGLLSLKVSVDGEDATDNLARRIKSSRFRDQIKLIALNGIALAGLNIVDIVELNSMLKIPIIAVTRKKPRLSAMSKAIIASTKSKSSARKKIALLKKIKEAAEEFHIAGFYVQCIGINAHEVKNKLGEVVSMLRISHIIASGISKGESKGRM